MMTLSTYMNDQTAYLDNSAAFKEYLRKYGMNDSLQKHGLKLRKTCEIVPHVCIS
jgi:hypothetical protein